MNAARMVVEQHGQAINYRDADAYRLTMNFPFTYQNYNGVALTIERAEDCGEVAPLPWDIILKTHPDWDCTEFDRIEEVAGSVSSVVYKIDFRRIDTSGRSDGVFQAIWIATRRGDHWGVQFRHNLGRQSMD
jgi:hypothetical protein